MLRQITVQQLKLGMYIQRFSGSWMDHPFWRTRFLLTSPEDLQRIQASSIREVWIDVSKGRALAQDAALPAEPERSQEPVAPVAPVPSPPTSVSWQPASFSDEIQRAAVICEQSREAVQSMFEHARMGRTIDVVGAQQLAREISDSVSRNALALISLARLKSADDYTYMHSVAVCAMMIALGRELGLDEEQLRSAATAGLLHDLGKALMPLDILNKPGSLTAEEFDLMKAHPVKGFELLESIGLADPIVMDVCLHHHEKMDESGYPDGLEGEEISLYARMGAVCDVYDAVTSDRPYKSGWDPAEAMHKMAKLGAAHFDQRVFQAFVKTVGIYPIGSLVRMRSGHLGVVVAHTRQRLTAPQVRLFFQVQSQKRVAPRLVDLSAPGCTDKIMAREDPAKWQFSDLNALWQPGSE